jgi:hypothetical protein
MAKRHVSLRNTYNCCSAPYGGPVRPTTNLSRNSPRRGWGIRSQINESFGVLTLHAGACQSIGDLPRNDSPDVYSAQAGIYLMCVLRVSAYCMRPHLTIFCRCACRSRAFLSLQAVVESEECWRRISSVQQAINYFGSMGYDLARQMNRLIPERSKLHYRNLRRGVLMFYSMASRRRLF